MKFVHKRRENAEGSRCRRPPAADGGIPHEWMKEENGDVEGSKRRKLYIIYTKPLKGTEYLVGRLICEDVPIYRFENVYK